MENNVPVYKELLTIKEIASIYGLGLHAIRRITNNETSLVIWNGNKRLIKRKAFEEFLFKQQRI